MYALDLLIYGMEKNIDGEGAGERERMQERADAIFAEVRRMVGEWIRGEVGWKGSEREVVEGIWGGLNIGRV